MSIAIHAQQTQRKRGKACQQQRLNPVTSERIHHVDPKRDSTAMSIQK